MNPKLLIWILAFSLGLNMVLVGGAVFHFSRLPPPEPPEKHHDAGSPPFTRILRFDEQRLTLTPSQRQKILAVRERWEQAEWRARGEAMQRMIRLGDLLVRDDLTTASLAPLFDDVRLHSSDFFSRLAQALREYRAVLDAKQNIIFTQLLQERINKLHTAVQGNLGKYQKWEQKRSPSPSASGLDKRKGIK